MFRYFYMRCYKFLLRSDWPGSGVHGDDDPTNDHASADAADPLAPTAAGFASAATSPHATAGTNTHHSSTSASWSRFRETSNIQKSSHFYLFVKALLTIARIKTTPE